MFGSGSMYRKGLGFADEGARLAQLARKLHGNSFASTKPAHLYRLNDEAGNLVKWGVTSADPIEGRYAKAFLKDINMVPIATGTRPDMFMIERWLAERYPGQLNHEPWAGMKLGEPLPISFGW